MIRYKIDGVAVAAPNKLNAGDQEISRSYEDADAIFRDKLIRRKRTVKWSYTLITKEEYLTIYNAIWRDKILSTGSRMFNITTEFPGEGVITSVMYLGTPTNFESIKGTSVNGIEYWSFEIDWIEKVGTKILSPGSLPI